MLLLPHHDVVFSCSKMKVPTLLRTFLQNDFENRIKKGKIGNKKIKLGDSCLKSGCAFVSKGAK
jgi:hypothetical protein